MNEFTRIGRALLGQPTSGDVQYAARKDALPDLPLTRPTRPPWPAPAGRNADLGAPAENGNQARNSYAGQSAEALALASSPCDSNYQTSSVLATCILTVLWDRSWDDSLIVFDKLFIFNQLDGRVGALGSNGLRSLLFQPQ